uniref:Uncharacterized protein n=1 Tax=Triticum urartu TaxID=4572 RepID=A0A8R7Q0Z0_TRIUA
MQICMLDVQPHQLFGFLHRICILSRYLEAFSSSIFHRLLVVHSKSCLLFFTTTSFPPFFLFCMPSPFGWKLCIRQTASFLMQLVGCHPFCEHCLFYVRPRYDFI